MAALHEINIKLYVADWQYKELERLAEALTRDSKKAGYDTEYTAESALEGLFQMGSTFDIANKIAEGEFRTGIREEYPDRTKVYEETKEKVQREQDRQKAELERTGTIAF